MFIYIPSDYLNADIMNLYPTTPFDSIGFSLSGGGFRASAFGLGVMSIMQELTMVSNENSKERSPLLQHVHFMSSTSGGTITCAIYAAAKAVDIPFASFYYHLNHLLQSQKLLDEVFNILNDDQYWLGKKHRNPINAFALVYQKTLFASSPYLEHYLTKVDLPKNLMDLIDSKVDSHIKEVCFNATEFTTGLPFRFQVNKGTPQGIGGVFGNDNISVHKTVNDEPWTILGKIRLADVLASSSCFPIGFEPLQFPDDFGYDGEASPDDLGKTLSIKTTTGEIKNSLALMDGGIVDNQGLDALLNAHKRKSLIPGRDGENSFDLLIVNDVASHHMEPFQQKAFESPKDWVKRTPGEFWSGIHKTWQKLPTYFQYARISTLFLVAVIIGIWFLEGTSTAIILLAIIAVGLLIGINSIKGINGKILSSKVGDLLTQPMPSNALATVLPTNKFEGNIANKLLHYIEHRPMSETVQWVTNRIGSGTTLFGTIFLKQVRRLIYYKLYSNPELFYKRVYNAIYTLSTTNSSERNNNPPLDIQGEETAKEYEMRKKLFKAMHDSKNPVSPEMIKVADLAYSMNTTLWFTQEDEEEKSNIREALIATGQFSTTYQLLQYTLQLQQSRYFNTLPPFYQARVNDLLEQLEERVIDFNNDPYYLVNRYKENVPQL